MAAIPAVARMQLRGFRMDTEAHARLMVDLAADRQEAETAYLDACRECGRDDLAARGMPSTPAGKEALLNTLLSSDELANWTRTAKAGRLSTKRAELRRAAHYGPIATLSRVAVLDKQLDSFGITLAAHVSPVTGRIHAELQCRGNEVSGRADVLAAELAADTEGRGGSGNCSGRGQVTCWWALTTIRWNCAPRRKDLATKSCARRSGAATTCTASRRRR